MPQQSDDNGLENEKREVILHIVIIHNEEPSQRTFTIHTCDQTPPPPPNKNKIEEAKLLGEVVTSRSKYFNTFVFRRCQVY